MPELPEVETTRQGLLPHVKGCSVSDCKIIQPALRWPVTDGFARIIKGQIIESVGRRGKYLLFHTTKGTILSHLGMSGKWYISDSATPLEAHTHCILTLCSGKTLRYVDPRRFGALLWTDQPWHQHELLSKLGPEPLEEGFTGEYLYKASRKRKKAVKLFIMDSHIVVGVGNIYANEALFASGIHPEKAAGSISLKRYQVLAEAIQSVLARAIKAGGTTLKDFHNGANLPGYFKQSLAVYGRGTMPCLKCGRRLKEVKLGQRQTVFCSNCQR